MSRRTSQKNSRLVLLGLMLGAAFGVAGAASAGLTPQVDFLGGSSESDGGPRQVAPSVDPSGPGLTSSEAIDRVLGNLGDPSVKSAEIINPPIPQQSTAPWLEVDIASNDGEDIKDVWLGELVQGAVADCMRTSETTNTQLISGGEMLDNESSGKAISTQLGTGSMTAGQHFNSPSDAALIDHVNQVADNYGLTASTIRILHPLESALIVTLVVPDGDVKWVLDQLTQSLVDQPVDVEGYYLELTAPDGTPLLTTGNAYRFGGGGVWFADGQDARFGVAYAGATGDDPPRPGAHK